ncbi:GGDEF domain-containing protein [uncultured Treponema sp.]|uniref:GGDEF domain-containing protein n=1 Tax=uncultured Treponema sp. TaxID=162155 RepID=UPI00260B5F2D|nr:GGDEF domain-containing protein [uncultured Treponema sp.]
MRTLEVKIAYLDENLKIIERNKEFYSTFEKVGFIYTSITDVVFPKHKADLLKFIKSGDSKDIVAFKFKEISGEYKYNIVTKAKEDFRCQNLTVLKLIDISNAFKTFSEAEFYEKKVAHVLSLTSEYLFSYQKSTNNFTMYNYIQNKRVTVYNQDIDAWKSQVITDGFIAESDVKEFEGKIEELKECNEIFWARFVCSLRSNKSVFEHMSLKAVKFIDNGEVYMLGRMLPEIVMNQSEKSAMLLQELKFDALTGVFNKKAISDLAQKRFVTGAKENALLAIVDLDHFKPVNDAYGHLAGDKVLARAGEILRNILGEDGVIGRYGGDEFLIILEDMQEETVFRGIFRTINNDMRMAFEDMFPDIKVTVSIGAARFPKDGSTFDELFKKADFCLYRAKDKGRDRYVFFREDLHSELYKKACEAKTEGIKYDVREVRELKSMSSFLLNLSASTKSAAETVLGHMLKTYNLDSINIYYGEAMERKFCLGQKSDLLSEARYVYSDIFKNALGSQAFIRIDFTTEVISPDFGKILDERGVKSSIQCVIGSQENPLGLITFDRLKESALWAEYEMNCCIMVAAALNLLPESKIKLLFV